MQFFHYMQKYIFSICLIKHIFNKAVYRCKLLSTKRHFACAINEANIIENIIF